MYAGYFKSRGEWTMTSATDDFAARVLIEMAISIAYAVLR